MHADEGTRTEGDVDGEGRGHRDMDIEGRGRGYAWEGHSEGIFFRGGGPSHGDGGRGLILIRVTDAGHAKDRAMDALRRRPTVSPS